MRYQSPIVLVFAASVLLFLASCAKENLNTLHIEPDPFADLKKSAICKVLPVKTDASGFLLTHMSVRSDGGMCAITLQRDNGKMKTSYSSFGAKSGPDHGRIFVYNYNHRTIVNYRPDFGYSGLDHFVVGLIPNRNEKRQQLDVTVEVDNTGVSMPPLVIVPTQPIVQNTQNKTSSKNKVRKSSAKKK